MQLPLAGSVLVIFAAFVMSNVPFGLLDLTGWPSPLVKYKIQDQKVNSNPKHLSLK